MHTIADEYEFQHFGFSVQQMKLENSLMVLKVAEKVTNKLLQPLITKLNINQEMAKTLAQQTLKNVCDKLTPQIRKMDDLIQKSFEIPDYVLLGEYLGDDVNYTKEQEEQLIQNCNNLKTKFMQNAILVTVLQNEIQKYNDMKTQVAHTAILNEKIRAALDTDLSLEPLKETTSLLKELHQ